MGFHNCYDNADIGDTDYMIAELQNHRNLLLQDLHDKYVRNRQRRARRKACGRGEVSEDESYGRDGNYLDELYVYEDYTDDDDDDDEEDEGNEKDDKCSSEMEQQHSHQDEEENEEEEDEDDANI